MPLLSTEKEMDTSSSRYHREPENSPGSHYLLFRLEHSLCNVDTNIPLAVMPIQAERLVFLCLRDRYFQYSKSFNPPTTLYVDSIIQGDSK